MPKPASTRSAYKMLTCIYLCRTLLFFAPYADFYSKEYQNFVESSIIVTPYGKNALKQKCITLDVCIRVNQLRTYLENNGIIRKFGL